MSKQNRRAAALLFWFQVVCAFIFASSQTIRMFTTTKGVSVSFFACHGAFALLLLILCSAAYRSATDPHDAVVKRQGVRMYAMWFAFVGIQLCVALAKMPHPWNSNDNLTMTIVAVGSITAVIVSKLRNLPFADPYVKAILAAFLKCVPQITLALNIYHQGSAGLSGIWIFMGHVTILTRLVHLYLSGKQGWDRNIQASFWSEVGNEASWCVATVAWLLF